MSALQKDPTQAHPINAYRYQMHIQNPQDEWVGEKTSGAYFLLLNRGAKNIDVGESKEKNEELASS